MVEVLSVFADIAAIATAAVAGWAYFAYQRKLKRKQLRLEEYLKAERSRVLPNATADMGQRSVAHLMARVAMTEADILEAAFSSGSIKSYVAPDPRLVMRRGYCFRMSRAVHQAVPGIAE